MTRGGVVIGDGEDDGALEADGDRVVGEVGAIEIERGAGGVGTHRRVRLEGLMECKRGIDAVRRAAIAELAAYDQEIGI